MRPSYFFFYPNAFIMFVPFSAQFSMPCGMILVECVMGKVSQKRHDWAFKTFRQEQHKIFYFNRRLTQMCSCCEWILTLCIQIAIGVYHTQNLVSTKRTDEQKCTISSIKLIGYGLKIAIFKCSAINCGFKNRNINVHKKSVVWMQTSFNAFLCVEQ